MEIFVTQKEIYVKQRGSVSKRINEIGLIAQHGNLRSAFYIVSIQGRYRSW